MKGHAEGEQPGPDSGPSFATQTERATRALLGALFDSTSDAILVVGQQGVIALANAACERLLGYRPEDLRGRPVESLVPARFADHARQRTDYVAHPSARAMGRGLDLVARHADGQEIPVDIALSPLVLDGQVWTVTSMRDMRARAGTRDTLRVQATALRSAANGIVITDRTGTITWVNPAACAITGYSSEELIGQHTRLLKSGEHDVAFYSRLWETVSRGETWSGTIINRRRDGSRYHEEQTIAPVVDEAGDITHFIAIKQDVTRRQRNEAALAQAHTELEARVAEVESLSRLLHEQAVRDPLTGLHNRRFLNEAIARDVARTVRSGEPLAVAIIDVDNFKQVNDRFGHGVGDLVLKALADVLRSQVRASDLACRLGGEEFVVVLPGAPLVVAEQCANRWRRAFAAAVVETGSGLQVQATVSIGVALHHGAHDAFERTLSRADAALYEAKRAGRNRVVLSEEPGS